MFLQVARSFHRDRCVVRYACMSSRYNNENEAPSVALVHIQCDTVTPVNVDIYIYTITRGHTGNTHKLAANLSQVARCVCTGPLSITPKSSSDSVGCAQSQHSHLLLDIHAIILSVRVRHG